MPAALVRGKGLRPRLGRVFRDEEELSASSSLSAEIEQALQASRYLIVVCSRDTPGSRWVNEEIVRFRQLGRHQRIRALLVDGEPHESFPPALYQLLTDDVPESPAAGDRAGLPAGEPLAADVRPQDGDSARVTKRLALLRLAAPLLGCRFDDLRQRDSERAVRRLRVIVAAAGVAVAVVGALAAVAVVQRNRATQRLQEVLTERGREEWLRGNAGRAVLPLASAYELSPESPALRFLLSQSLARVVPRRSFLSDADDVAPDPLISQDGSRLTIIEARGRSSNGARGRASVWDLSTPRLVPVLDDEDAAFADATRDGRHILTTDSSGKVMLWETASGRRIAMIGPLGPRLAAVRLSDDAARVVAVHEDGQVEAWDVASGRRLQAWYPEPKSAGDQDSSRLRPVSDADFSPDGARIVTVASDGMVRLWEAQTAALVASLDTTARTARPLSRYRYKSAAVKQTTFSPDGTLLVTLTLEGTACLWDAGSGRFLSPIALAPPPVTSTDNPPYLVVFFLEFSADGRMLLLSASRFFNLWDVHARTTGAAVPMAALDSAGLSHSGKSVVMTGDDGLRIWDAETGRVVARLETRARSAFFSPDDRSLVSVDRDATVKLWPLDAVTPVVLRGHKQTVHSIEFSPDSRRIVTASADKMAKVWEAGSGRLVTTAAVHDEEVLAATFSPEGSRVLTIGLEGRATIMTPDTDVGIGDLVPPEGGPDTVAARFLSGGRQIVTVGRDRAVRVWDAASAAQRFQLPGKVSHCDSIPFSLDGRLAFTLENEQAKIWNTADGVLVATLPGEASSCAAFSPDGRRLVTGRGGAFVPARVWDPADGRLISSFEDSGDHQWTVAFSPDNRVVATAFDKTGVQPPGRRERPAAHAAGHGKGSPCDLFQRRWLFLVTAGHGGARLWDPGRGVLLAVFAEHASLGSVAISPDGTRLATAGENAHAMVWPIAAKDLSPTEVRRLLSCYVPWFLQNGTLVSRASTPAECSSDSMEAPKASR